MTTRVKRNPTRFNPEVAEDGVSIQATTESNTAELDDLVARFNTAWRQSVESIIESGQVLIEAKEALKKVKGHGNWMLFLEKIKIEQRTANYLMQIAEHLGALELRVMSGPGHVDQRGEGVLPLHLAKPRQVARASTIQTEASRG